MQLYESNPVPPTSIATDANPQTVDLDHPLNPAPDSVLTCVERRESFLRVQAAVHDEFHPKSDFQRLLADDLAESLWTKTRYSALVTQTLDSAIKASWHEVTQRYPAADSALRTHLAWEEVASKPAHHKAADEFTRAHRRVLAEARLLAAFTTGR